jgi:hypothetical protein
MSSLFYLRLLLEVALVPVEYRHQPVGHGVYYLYYYPPDILCDIHHMCCIENETRAADSRSRQKLSTESARQK